MYRITDKQKRVLRLAGWSEPRIEAASFATHGIAWREVREALDAYSERRSRITAAEYDRLGQYEIADAIRSANGF